MSKKKIKCILLIENTLNDYEKNLKDIIETRANLITDRPLRWSDRIKFIDGKIEQLSISISDLKFILNNGK
jgi:hypothetical protein